MTNIIQMTKPNSSEDLGQLDIVTFSGPTMIELVLIK